MQRRLQTAFACSRAGIHDYGRRRPWCSAQSCLAGADIWNLSHARLPADRHLDNDLFIEHRTKFTENVHPLPIF
eukprot:6191695-Pleurochrysis_carterae.AAC.1